MKLNITGSSKSLKQSIKEETLNEFINYMDMHQQAYISSIQSDKDILWIDSEYKMAESTLSYVQKIAKKYLRATK